MEKRLECVEGNSSKFWEVKVSGSKTVVTYGKIGSAGQTQEKDHGSATAATKFAEKQMKEKEKKGYSTKRAAPAASRGAPSRRARGARGGAARGRGGRGGRKKEEEEEEADDDEEEDDNDDEGDDQDSQGKPLSKPPTAWRVKFGHEMVFAIYINDKAVYAGDESGRVVELSHEGKFQRMFKLPEGVKCVVGDGPFLYAGCNNGSLYDLTQGVPRLMCKLEAFAEVYWLDIKYGMLAASDSAGNVALVNGEGETVWSHKDPVGSGGWMVRMDDTGVYHGHSMGVVKYDLKGQKIWENRDSEIHGIMFGCQDEKYVYPASSNNVMQLDKGTGKSVREFPATSPPANAVSADGKFVIPADPFKCYEGATGQVLWHFSGGNFLSMAFYGSERVFGVGNGVFCFDVSAKAVAEATEGKWKQVTVTSLKIKATDEIAPSETVETTKEIGNGILCECIKEGPKLRVRVTHKGFDSSWNVQFPQAIREAGAKYVVEQILESKQGGFYRALGNIQKLAK